MNPPDFDSLNLPIAPLVRASSLSVQQDVFDYLSGLTPRERMGYTIAFDHLGMSFNVLRCNGFKNWQKERDKAMIKALEEAEKAHAEASDT